MDPIPVSVDSPTMKHALHSGGESENILVNLKLVGEDREILTLVRDTQHNPLSGALEHLDFLQISLDRPLTTMVSLHPVGTPRGVREGGIFESLLRELEIECLPLDIPDFVEIDVSEMDQGKTLHVSDIPVSEKYSILTPKDRAIALVMAPKVETLPSALAEATVGDAKESAEGKEG
jgi:large subunit ribosomal protein L25